MKLYHVIIDDDYGGETIEMVAPAEKPLDVVDDVIGHLNFIEPHYTHFLAGTPRRHEYEFKFQIGLQQPNSDEEYDVDMVLNVVYYELEFMPPGVAILKDV